LSGSYRFPKKSILIVAGICLVMINFTVKGDTRMYE
jgi:hypothetical protein